MQIDVHEIKPNSLVIAYAPEGTSLANLQGLKAHLQRAVNSMDIENVRVVVLAASTQPVRFHAAAVAGWLEEGGACNYLVFRHGASGALLTIGRYTYQASLELEGSHTRTELPAGSDSELVDAALAWVSSLGKL